MSGPPPLLARQSAPVGPAERTVVVLVTVLLGVGVDLFALLLLPVRVQGVPVPAGPLLAATANAGLGLAARWRLDSTFPAKLLLGLALLLSVSAASAGPGGDLLVTRDLQDMYLLLIAAAAFGACVPLFFGRRPGGYTRRSDAPKTSA